MERASRACTFDLLIQPDESLAGELLLRGPVCEGVRDGHVLVVLENGTLHRQLVQIRIEERDNALRVGRRAIEIHHGDPQLGTEWANRP